MRRLYYWIGSNNYFYLFCVLACILLPAGILISIVFIDYAFGLGDLFAASLLLPLLLCGAMHLLMHRALERRDDRRRQDAPAETKATAAGTIGRHVPTAMAAANSRAAQ